MMRALVALAIGLLCTVGNAHSQPAPRSALFGINDVGLVIESLDEDSLRCGFKAQSLETSLRFILSQSRLRVATDSRGKSTFVYLQVASLQSCISSIRLEVIAPATIRDTNVFVPGAVIWSETILRGGGVPSDRTLANIEELAKMLVVEWNQANK